LEIKLQGTIFAGEKMLGDLHKHFFSFDWDVTVFPVCRRFSLGLNDEVVCVHDVFPFLWVIG